jgi:hypothetical protein
MRQWFRSHLTYSNVMVTILAFMVLGGGSAVALRGSNRVFSDDIVNGQVKKPDLGPGAVTNPKLAASAVDSAKVADETLSGTDVGGLTGADIVAASLTGEDIQGNSLGGAQINEAALGEVVSAQIGGFGRHNGGGFCNPNSTAFVDCSITSINLPIPAKVLLLGNIASTSDAGNANGTCKLVTNTGDVANATTHPAIYEAHESDTLGITGITGVLAAGSHDFAIDCNETDPDIRYLDQQITAVAISPD